MAAKIDQMEVFTNYSQVESVVHFSTDWNKKLALNIFPTMRPYSRKYKIGCFYTVKLKGKEVGVVQLVHSSLFTPNRLTQGMSLIDTGYGRDVALGILKKMYKLDSNSTKTFKMLFLYFKFVHRTT